MLQAAAKLAAVKLAVATTCLHDRDHRILLIQRLSERLDLETTARRQQEKAGSHNQSRQPH